MSELLLYAGIAVAGASVIAGVAVLLSLWIAKRKLNEKFDAEYGKNP